jgi:hypothetical protein
LEVSGQLHAPAALPPEKSPRYPFYRRLGGPQSRSGRYGEGKILTIIISVFKLYDVWKAGTASLVYWLEFLATDPEVSGSIPGATRLSEK